MNRKTWIIGFTIMGAIFSAESALLVGGDFEGNVRVGNNNSLTYADVDKGGWESKNFQWGTGNAAAQTFSGGEATDSATGDGLAQVNSITTESGTSLQLKFDWTAAALATGADLDIRYQLVAWNIDDGQVLTDDELFDAINFFTTNVKGTTGGTGYNLLNSTESISGNVNAAFTANSFTGTAGSTQTETVTINLTGVHLGDLSNYDVIGIKFIQTENAVSGGILDNVSLTVIPEPATLGLISGFGASILFIRRSFML